MVQNSKKSHQKNAKGNFALNLKLTGLQFVSFYEAAYFSHINNPEKHKCGW